MPSLDDFVRNAAPALAWRFVEVGDEHSGDVLGTEVRDALDADREPITDANGEIVQQPVMTLVDDDSGEERSWYMKPSAVSAYVLGCKRAGVEPFTDTVRHVHVRFSSEGVPSKSGWNAPQRFVVTVNGND